MSVSIRKWPQDDTIDMEDDHTMSVSIWNMAVERSEHRAVCRERIDLDYGGGGAAA